MNLIFSPIRMDTEMIASVMGETLTLNGEAFDLSAIPEGATLPREAVACEWLASDVERIDGVLHLTLILPHGANAPHETRFPEPIIATDGPIALPAYEVAE